MVRRCTRNLHHQVEPLHARRPGAHAAASNDARSSLHRTTCVVFPHRLGMLLRWRREYQVSLRLPNRLWKVPHDVLVERLEIT